MQQMYFLLLLAALRVFRSAAVYNIMEPRPAYLVETSDAATANFTAHMPLASSFNSTVSEWKIILPRSILHNSVTFLTILSF
jgi:hypothetical protein